MDHKQFAVCGVWPACLAVFLGRLGLLDGGLTGTHNVSPCHRHHRNICTPHHQYQSPVMYCVICTPHLTSSQTPLEHLPTTLRVPVTSKALYNSWCIHTRHLHWFQGLCRHPKWLYTHFIITWSKGFKFNQISGVMNKGKQKRTNCEVNTLTGLCRPCLVPALRCHQSQSCLQ